MSAGELKWIKNDNKTWSVSFLTQFGRRVVNTGQTDKREALRQAVQVRLKMRQAHRFEAKVIQMFSTGKLVKLKVALDEWIDSLHASGSAQGTQDCYRAQVMAFLRHSKLCDEQVCAISVQHVNRWVNGEGKQRFGTRQLKLVVLKLFLNFCMYSGYVTGNPAQVVRKVNTANLSHEQREPTRKVPFTDEEIGKVLNYVEMSLLKDRTRLLGYSREQRRHSPVGYDVAQRVKWMEFWGVAIPVSRWAGLRIGDICTLEWKSIMPDALVVWTGKRDKRVDIPLNEQLRTALRQIQKTNERFCFPFFEKLYASKKKTNIQHNFRRMLEVCGITDKTFHCLRSSASIDMLDRMMAAGKTREEAVEIVRAMLGHGSAGTTERHYLNGEIK